ncbi:MAG: hypothetical protein GX607_07210 [Myxococcales bacterium]|nr:hypothetical protein [Myxococcales bacterium]
MTQRALRLLLASLLVGLPVAFASGGCSRQGEGERCSLLNGNEDCSGSLVCTPANELRGGDDRVDRCCPAEDRTDAVPSCRPRTGSGAPTGGTSSGGAGGAGGAG